MSKHSPAKWVPTLYFVEALPYVAVMSISVILYKRMGISNTDIALYTGWLYLPWVIKPFWSPFVELFKNNRWWIVITQIIIGFAFAGVAFTIPTSLFFRFTLAFFWLMAFTSATHDIAADGFYIQALNSHNQSLYVGIRSTFYRLATLFGQGVLVIIAGVIESNTGLESPILNIDVSPSCSTTTQTTLPIFDVSESNNNQRVLFTSNTIQMNPVAIGEDSCDLASVISNAKRLVLEHNIKNNFIYADTTINISSSNSPSQLTEFEQWIKESFGEVDKPTEDHQIGNIAIVGVRLSQQPEVNDNITMQISLDNGDKSIAIDETSFVPRFSFNHDNWDKIAYFIIKTDPHIQELTSATFVVSTGSITLSWTIVFAALSVLLLIFAGYHSLVLPKQDDILDNKDNQTIKGVFKEFGLTIKSFFSRPQIISALLFMLFFRFPEAQLVKLSQPFMLDSIGQGGLGLTTGQVGFVYGTIGMIGITLGGILGGIAVARGGLKKWFWYMIMAISLPDLVYVWLSFTQNNSMFAVNTCVFVEQFGYGFGFTAYMLYLIYFSRGDRSTAVYAISTAFMALGMMIPGMLAGWLEDLIGYKHFFIYVMICCLVTFIVSAKLKIDPNFGKKENTELS